MTPIKLLKRIKSTAYSITRFLNPAYLSRYLRLAKAARRKEPFVATMPGVDIPMNIDPDGYFARHYLVGHPFEPELIDFVKGSVRSGMTVYDIGANIGYFTLLFARLTKPGRVMAFEPGDYAFRQLKSNIAVNGFDNVTAFQLPLGDVDKTDTYYEADQEGFDVYNSFVPVDIPQVAGSGVNFRPRQVRICTLDSLMREKQLPPPDFIKMDVEGYEMKVFEGMKEFLASGLPVTIAFEFSGALCEKFGFARADFEAKLGSFGFSLHVLESSGLKPLAAYDASWPGGTLVAVRR